MPQRPSSADPASSSGSRARFREVPLRLAGIILVALLLAAGCEQKGFFNPSELVDPQEGNRLRADGRARPRVQNILSELDLGVTKVPVAFTDARDVRAGDLLIDATDYRIGPSDLVEVSIADLGPGQTAFVRPLRVSETGALTLPDLEQQVRVVGLTETEAVQAIEQAYVAEGVFVEPPPVSLIVVDPASKVFNINGSVARPGRYVLATTNYRMYDALTQAGGAVDPEVVSEYAYIIRSTRNRAPNQGQNRQDPNDPLDPNSSLPPEQTDRQWPFDQPAFAAAQNQPGGARQQGGFEFPEPQAPADTEIIRVPLRELLRGRLQYNVVIRAEDTIIVPPPVTGVYYVGGHVTAPGVYLISPGNRVTIKQAIVSARMLDELAIPNRTQFVRRVDDQDVFIRIDLAKIFVGTEPDIYLQPEDQIYVGSNAWAPFLASFRNAFRITYGFGFLYDRNFAYDRDERFGF